MIKKNKFFLILILIFTSINFLFHLTDFPSGFYQNEASFGYNAYSLLKTGFDEYGRNFPLILESFGDYKLAFYSYFLIPFIGLFGLTEFAVRISAVVSGIVLLLITYFIIKKIFNSQRLALLSSLFFTTSPWIIIFARTANETILAVCLFYISVLSIINWNKSGRHFHLFISSLFLSLSVITYYSAWLPALFSIIVILILLMSRFRKSKKTLFGGLIIVAPTVIIIYLTINRGMGRLKQINIFENSGANLILNEQIREDQSNFPGLLVRFLHNKLLFYHQSVLSNLSDNLNLKFLFTAGDEEEKVYRIPNSGVLLPVLLPLILLGTVFLVRNYLFKINFIIYGLVFTGFLGSALSIHGSVAQRTLIISPPFALIGAFGSDFITKYFKVSKIRNFLYGILIILFVYESLFFYHQYFYHAAVHQPWYRNFGVKEMVEKTNYLSNKYDKVYVSGNPYIFFYFYNSVFPEIAQVESKNIKNDLDSLGHPIRERIGKYYVLPIDCPAAGKPGFLFICRGNKIPPNSRIIDIINYKDGQPDYIYIDFNTGKNYQIPPHNVEFMKSYGLIDPNRSYDYLEEKDISK